MLLLTPLPESEVVFLTLSGGFLVYLRVAVVVGLLLALPVILYQALGVRGARADAAERRAALPWIPLSVVFFLLGVAGGLGDAALRDQLPARLPDRGLPRRPCPAPRPTSAS